MSKIHKYASDDLEVRYDVRRCIHAAECVRGLPEVFNPKSKPWVSPDAASADEVAEVIHRCPTGALTYERRDGGTEETAPDVNTVRVSPDGPVYLHGNLRVEDADGNVRRETRMALCRCGASYYKPYCDGSHTKVAFEDPGVVGTAKTKDADGDGALHVQVTPDGPAVLQGPHRLVDGEGNLTQEAGSGYLCRCGRSSNRPFCDGSHKQETDDAGPFRDPGVFSD